ncbi:hypothetical protein GCM10025792_16860 [Pseudonocardia tropica]
MERRGGLVTRNEVTIVSGSFAAFVVNAAVYGVRDEVDAIWRVMLLVALLPAIVPAVGMPRPSTCSSGCRRCCRRTAPPRPGSSSSSSPSGSPLVFVYRVVPETRGRSLEQLEAGLRSHYA